MSLVRFDGAKDIDQAAGMAISMAIRVEPPAMAIEFIAWSR